MVLNNKLLYKRRREISQIKMLSPTYKKVVLNELLTYFKGYFRKVYQSIQVRVPRNIRKYLSFPKLPQKWSHQSYQSIEFTNRKKRRGKKGEKEEKRQKV